MIEHRVLASAGVHDFPQEVPARAPIGNGVLAAQKVSKQIAGDDIAEAALDAALQQDPIVGIETDIEHATVQE